MPTKSVKPCGRILATLQLATRLYTYVVPPPRFCLDSDALAPRFDETLTSLKKGQTCFVYPTYLVSKVGRPLDFFARLC